MWAEYDYVLVNQDIDAAYAALVEIYRAEKLKRTRNLWLGPFVEKLLSEEI